jgi:5-methylcytosine-specific restriction protein A
MADKARASAHARGYGRRWQKTSAGFLLAHPLCSDPYGLHGNAPRAAEVTDHIIPHRGNMGLFWDPKNWQPLCRVCHNRKTAREDGGFGRSMKKAEVIVVCGPPASGKSTYINARRAVGDLVWDHDAMMMALTGIDSHERSDRSKSLLHYVFAMRDAFYAEALRNNSAERVWIIESCPTENDRQRLRQRFDAKIVLLDTPEEVCAQRIVERGPGWEAPLALWFKRYREDQTGAGSNV